MGVILGIKIFVKISYSKSNALASWPAKDRYFFGCLVVLMEKISWIDHVRNEDVLLRVKEQRNILHEISKRKTNWIGHILRRNCLLQRVTEGKIQGGIEVTGKQGRRRRKL
jgi:hypothetical protein